jgi:hypothetical protein
MANRVQKYLKNLDKEITDIYGNQQRTGSGETAKKLKGTPKGKAAANKLRNDRGQMFGALLQGKRYDEKGKQITKQTPKKPAPKKPVAPRTPSKGTKTPMPKIQGAKPGVKKPMPKTITKAPARMPAMPKTKTVGNRKKVLIMPDKISPSKMTPAQKAKYLQNPERYDK